MPAQPAEPEDSGTVAGDLRAVGDRIETLLDASSAGGAVARERSEELVRLLSELYGAGLERIMDILYEQGSLTAEVLAALAGDDLVASLLLIHGLHPEDLPTRVERALNTIRPYLGSHGGDVELLGITEQGVARLRLLGSCDGCSSSAATMSLAVEDAISQAAPEITGFEVEQPSSRSSASAGRGLLPLAVVPHVDEPAPQLPRAAQQHTGPSSRPEIGSWATVLGLDDLVPGEVRGLTVRDASIIVCRNGDDLLAFHDGCPGCGTSLGAGHLERRLGAAIGGAVLTCPSCHAHYDVRLAGSSIDHAGVHLEPLPLLARGDHIEVALPIMASAGMSGAVTSDAAVLGLR